MTFKDSVLVVGVGDVRHTPSIRQRIEKGIEFFVICWRLSIIMVTAAERKELAWFVGRLEELLPGRKRYRAIGAAKCIRQAFLMTQLYLLQTGSCHDAVAAGHEAGPKASDKRSGF